MTKVIAKRTSGPEALDEGQIDEVKEAVERIVNDAWEFEGGRPGGAFSVPISAD